MELPILAQIAKEAGDEILRMQKDIVQNRDWEDKPDGSQVTPADKKAHEMVCTGLQKHFPGVAILSEEYPDADNATALKATEYFATDPLDNTSGYIKNKTGFSVNIGRVRDGIPVEGVIYFPAMEEMYFTGSDGKAYLQKGGAGQNLIQVKEMQVGSPLQIAVGFNEKNIPALPAGVTYEATSYPAQYRICMVATGKCDLTGINSHSGGFNTWDTAGPHAVLIAAGGDMYGLEGMPIRYALGEIKVPPHLLGAKGTMLELKLAKKETIDLGADTHLMHLRDAQQQQSTARD